MEVVEGEKDVYQQRCSVTELTNGRGVHSQHAERGGKQTSKGPPSSWRYHVHMEGIEART